MFRTLRKLSWYYRLVFSLLTLMAGVSSYSVEMSHGLRAALLACMAASILIWGLLPDDEWRLRRIEDARLKLFWMAYLFLSRAGGPLLALLAGIHWIMDEVQGAIYETLAMPMLIGILIANQVFFGLIFSLTSPTPAPKRPNLEQLRNSMREHVMSFESQGIDDKLALQILSHEITMVNILLLLRENPQNGLTDENIHTYFQDLNLNSGGHFERMHTMYQQARAYQNWK